MSEVQQSTPNEEFVNPYEGDPRIQHFVDLNEKIVSLLDPNKYSETSQRMCELDAEIKEEFPDEKERSLFLAELYKVLVLNYLKLYIHEINNEKWTKVIDIIARATNESLTPNEIKKIAKDNGLDVKAGKDLDRYCKAAQGVQHFGYDRPRSSLKKSPFNPPFEKIDIDAPEWQLNLELGENFMHAFSKTSYSQAFVSEINSGRRRLYDGRIPPRSLITVYKLAMSALRIVESYIKELEGKFDTEKINLNDILLDLKELVRGRLLSRIRHVYDIPESFISLPDNNIQINNVDPSRIFVLLWEMAKNSIREGKISPDEISGFENDNDPYLQIKTDEVEIDGKKVVAIELVDRGRPINIPGIIEKLGEEIFGYEGRDVTLGDVLDTLSRRHMSIPLEDGQQMSTGIGYHSARKIAQQYNGDIFPANLRKEDGGGVGFLILIPKEGTESDFKIGDLKISGLQCKEISNQIAAIQEQLQFMITALIAGAIASRKMRK